MKTYGGIEQINASIKAYQNDTKEDHSEKIAELKQLRDELIKEHRIT